MSQTSPKLLSALAAVLFAGLSASAIAAPRFDPQEGARATDALNLLEAKGDGDFSNFKPAGADFSADVVQNGKTVHVTIDPVAGTITEQHG